MKSLTFGRGNAKLGKDIWTFSLPAGWTCPGASECLSRVREGRIEDGKHAKVRCFAASQEAMYPSVHKSRVRNFEALKGLSFAQMADLIAGHLPLGALKVRIHVSGDFFSQAYFDAWVEVARRHPGIVFYAYTKSVKFWVGRLHLIPANFKLTASKGGRDDRLIKEHNLKYAEIVFSVGQAEALGLEIDHDDSHAYASDKSFALLLHGTQAKGSEAAKALSALRAKGHKGYSPKRRERARSGD